MRLVPSILILCSCATGPSGRAADTSGERAVSIDTARVRVLATFQQSGWDSAVTVIVDDQVALSTAWSTAHAGRSDVPALPWIDFSRDRAVVVAAGMRTSGGYVLKLEEHRVAHDTLVIGVVLQRPGANCGTTAQLTAPAILLAVPRAAVAPRVAMLERDGPSC